MKTVLMRENLCKCGHSQDDHAQNFRECLHDDCDCVCYRALRNTIGEVHEHIKVIEPFLKKIAAEHHLTPAAILGSSRHPNVVRGRMHAMAVLRWSTMWSFPLIGKIFNRDHTTVMAHVKKWEEHLNTGVLSQ